MFNLLKKPKKIEGEIGYFNLEDWWLATFTRDERDHIESVFQPLGLSVGFEKGIRNKPLTEGIITSTSQTSAGLLTSLAGWFNNKDDRYLAKKIIEKAYEEALKGNNILDLHFTLQTMMEIYYRERDEDPAALEKAIKACEEQIKIATDAAKAFFAEYPNQPLPAHAGYEQLVIFLKKQGKYEEAIALCQKAIKQGWSGSWDNRIADMKKKQEKKPLSKESQL